MRIALLFLFVSSAFAQTAVYPSAIAGDSQLRVATNLVQSTLTAPISATDTSLTVLAGTGFVPNGLITVDSEVMAVCAVSGTSITVGKSTCPNVDGRAFDGSSATAHAGGAKVGVFVNAWYHNSLSQEVKAIETALGTNLSNVLSFESQSAHQVLIGPVTGVPTTPSFRVLDPADIPGTLTSSTSGSAASFSGALAGDVTGTQGATVVSRIGGLTPGPCATLDCSNASNLSSGTVPAGRLPLPTASTVGGIQSKTCSAGNFVSVIGTDGTVVCSVPSGSGNVIGPGTVTNGFLPQWGNSSNTLTTGLPVSASAGANTVPIANSSGQLVAGWMPAYSGDASSTIGNTVLTLAAVLSGSGACGDATHVCALTTNAKGLVVAQTATAITAVAGGSTTQLQVNTSGVLAGLADFTFGTPHTLNLGSSGILDAHLGSVLLPGSLSTGLVTVTTSTGVISSVAAPSGAVVGTSDTQTLTGKSIAGSEINSGLVTATVGGTGADLHASTGLVRAGNPFTASELSVDATTSGSNAVTVLQVHGVTYPATPPLDAVPVVTATNTATYTGITNCGDSSHALGYSTTTHLFSCQAITAAAGAVSLDSLLSAGGANTLANGDNPQVWNWALTTLNQVGFTIGETTAAASPGENLLWVQTKAGSLAPPITITAGGATNGVQMSTTGVLEKIGSGSISADHYNASLLVRVVDGGTGQAFLTDHGVLLGQGTAAVSATSAGANDVVLQGRGASNDPDWVALTNCGDATHALSYSTSTHMFGCQAVTSSATAGGSPSTLQYNDSLALGGVADFTYDGTHTIASGASGILDLHAGAFKLPGSLSTGLVTVTTSTGVISSVAAPSGAVVGTSDTQTLTNKSISASQVNSGLLPIAIGGTGQSTATAAYNALSPVTTLGDLIYGDGSNSNARLAGNTTATQKYLCQTGTGSVSAAPAWCTLSGAGVTTVTNDTNVTGSIVGNNLTLGWTGTLAAGRLNSGVVQAVTNDTNLTGSITSQNLTLAWSGQLSIARGGTGQATASAAFSALWPGTTLGDIVYGGAAGVGARLAGNTTTTRKFLTQTGDSVNSAAPAWNILASADIPNNAANTTGLAGTATALASSPTLCPSGQVPQGVDTHGSVVNCTVSGSGVAFGSLGDFYSISGGVTATFTPGWTFSGTQMLVFLDGLKQRPGTDYSVVTNTVVFASIPPAGALIEVIQ